MPDQVRVFVSHHHSQEEDAFTARLVADLQAAGADVWVDTAGITSDDFVRRISEGLEGRQWLVLVMTPAALVSPWVQREVNVALAEHTAGRMLGVLPLVMQPCRDQAIPMLWRTLHRYDATKNYERALRGLLHALSLSEPGKPVHAPKPTAPERAARQGAATRQPNTSVPRGRDLLPALPRWDTGETIGDVPAAPFVPQLAANNQLPRLHVSPLSLDFGMLAPHRTYELVFSISNRGGGSLQGHIEKNLTALTTEPTTIDDTVSELRVRVNTEGLAEGPYVCHVAVRTNGGDQIMPIRFSVHSEGR